MKANQTSILEEFDLAAFKILVLSHKRTFTEKIAAVTNACFYDQDLTKMKEKIRHLYDLTLLLRDPIISRFVRTKSYVKMIDEAREGDKLIPDLAKHANTPWRSAAVFKSPKESLARLKDTYESQLGPLVFDKDKMPAMDEIEKMLKAVAREIAPKPAKGKSKSKLGT